MIHAETHSDDRAVEVEFDVTPYFKEAPTEDLVALINCGFSHDEPADRVAEHLAESNEEVAAMFTYLEARNKATRKSIGFEVSVDEEQAFTWLDSNRPEVLAHINLADHDLAKCDRCLTISSRDNMQKHEKKGEMWCETCTSTTSP